MTTDQQDRMMETMLAINSLKAKSGAMPSIPELSKYLTISTTAIQFRIQRAVDEGYLAKGSPKHPRNIQFAKTIAVGNCIIPVLGVCN